MAKFKVTPPVGNLVVSKEVMNEDEVRELMVQLIQDSDSDEVWREKALNDPIEQVVEFLEEIHYKIEKVK